MLFPKNIEEKLNFEIIRQFLSERCQSAMGREKVRQFSFCSDFDGVLFNLRSVHEMKQILLFEDNFPSGFFPDDEKMFNQKEQAGSYFTESELMEIKASLENVLRLTKFFTNPKIKEYTALKSLMPEIGFAEFIIKSVNGILDRSGEMKDNASPDLKKIRYGLESKKSSISRTLNQIIAKAQADGFIEAGTQAAMREGKLLIPVSTTYKRKIKGIVYDISASGQTGYIEPFEVTELNNEIRELEMAEKREMLRILTEITEAFRPYFPQIVNTYSYLAEMDFIQSKAKLAIEIDGVLPDLQNKAHTKLRQAGHPLLLLAYKSKDKKVVRSDIALSGKKRMMVISGPNAGGKSVSLKTVGILQYMLQCGLLIPAKESSQVGIFNHIFIDIGDEQSVEDDLSTYSSHLLNMKFFTENADANSLVLIDEMGSGTEPHLGAAIAEAVLESLIASQAKAVITTHYANLKAFAENTQGAFNAAMLFDRENLSPLYELEIGKPGSSFAFEIAEKTGLSPKILESAKSKTDHRQLDFEEVLKKAMSEKRNLRRTKRKLRAEEEELLLLKEKYQKGAEFVLSEKKKILQEARLEAEKILESANKKIENTIAQIRKNQADKETTKALRTELDNFKNQYTKDLSQREQKLQQKIEKFAVPQTSETPDKHNITGPVRKGDAVKIKGQNTVGELLEIRGKDAEVAMGNLRMTVKLSELTKTQPPQKSKNKASITLLQDDESTRGSEMFGIDIRGKRAEEAVSIVRQYVDSALISRTRHLKILHGTGNGVLRQVVREYLASHQNVKSFADERLEAGGHGITLAELEF